MSRTFSIPDVQPATREHVLYARAMAQLAAAEEHEQQVERNIERHGGIGSASFALVGRLWHAHEVVLLAEHDVAVRAERLGVDWAWC